MRKLLIFAVLAGSLFFALPEGDRDSSLRAAILAAPQDYAFTYTAATNHYWATGNTYSFTGLDTAQQYVFQAIFTNEFGNLGEVIASKIIGPGTTTGVFGYNVHSFTPVFSSYVIVDNFDQILTRHYIAPNYLTDWQTDDGVTNAVDKQGIMNPPYAELSADGYHHDFDSTLVTVRNENYVLLHYNLNTTDRFVRLFDMSDHSEVASFDLEEFDDYNNNVGTSYVALNITGDALAFVDATRSAAAFVSAADNPHTFELSQGAYEYGRYTGADTFVSFGESVLLVSAGGGSEWSITGRSTIVDSGSQVLTLTQATEAIWDAYQNQTLIDSAVGTVDDTDYPFDTSRKFAFTVGTVADSPATVTWYWEALSLFEPSLDPNIFHFEIPFTYEIIADTVSDATVHIDNVLTSFGMDSDFGQIIVMVILMLVGMMITRNAFVALAVFFAVGGAFILLGFATVLTGLLFAGGAVLAVIMFIRSNNSMSEA